MSSKEQYKDLVKRLNQEIRDLKKENEGLQYTLSLANKNYIEALQNRITKREKKWYQFWKH